MYTFCATKRDDYHFSLKHRIGDTIRHELPKLKKWLEKLKYIEFQNHLDPHRQGMILYSETSFVIIVLDGFLMQFHNTFGHV